MVALAIIAIAFTAMLSSQAHNIGLAADGKFQTTAPLLAQDVMARLLAEGRTPSGSNQGDWGENFADYSWQVQATPALPMERDLQDLWQVDVTVSWQHQPRYTYQQRGYLFSPQPAP
jgi:Tfp pilus assembly protein PilV